MRVLSALCVPCMFYNAECAHGDGQEVLAAPTTEMMLAGGVVALAMVVTRNRHLRGAGSLAAVPWALRRHLSAAIRSGRSWLAWGAPQPVTASQPGPAWNPSTCTSPSLTLLSPLVMSRKSCGAVEAVPSL
jgi:hypothetical protein